MIRSFSEISMRDVSRAGGKGASLGEMTQAGFPIPDGFVVLSESFDQFLDGAELRQEIDAELRKCDREKMHTIERASERIQKMILEATMPSDIESEILEAYITLLKKQETAPPQEENPIPLQRRGGLPSEGVELVKEQGRSSISSADTQEALKKNNTAQPFLVAVRSSATAEDSHSAAWAGQLDSFLNTTQETLLQNIQKCWASLFTPRAIFYRLEQGLEKSHVSVAVVIQTMIQSEISGIAFSVHPVTQDPDQLIIEAGWGLGEAIVSGSITPDSYVVFKKSTAILDINIAEQEKMLVKNSPNGVETQNFASLQEGKEKKSPNHWVSVPASKREQQKLTDSQILELSVIITRIESHYAFPCDIEWAFVNEKFFITQSRPITTLGNIIDNKVNFDAENALKECVYISYEEFLLKYKQVEWEKVGNWKVPFLSFDLFYVSQSRYYLERFGFFQDISPIQYLQIGSNVFVSHEDLQIVREKIFEKLDLEGMGILDDIDRKLEVFRDDVYKEFLKIERRKEKKITYLDLLRIFEKILTVLASFEILRDMSTYLERSIEKRLKELGLPIIPVAELLNKDTESDIARLNESLESLKKFGYVKRDLDKLIKKFAYLNQYFLSGEGYSAQYFKDYLSKDSCLENAGEEKKHVFKDVKLNEFVRVMNRFSLIRLLNNEVVNKTIYALKPFFEKMAVTHKISFEEIVSFPLSEFLKIWKNEKPRFSNIKNRDHTVLISTDKEYILSEKDAEMFFDDYERKNKKDRENVTEIKGISTYKGISRGRVIIVSGSDDFFSVGDENILVCSMTDPNYIAVMKKAKAFVTDMGGILCHAAIVSRELKKPCIIGTKIATQVLHDGDLVEVDADNGVVRILERAGEGKKEHKTRNGRNQKKSLSAQSRPITTLGEKRAEGNVMKKPCEYQKLFQWNGNFPYLLSDFIMSVYVKFESVLFCDGDLWQIYMPTERKEKALVNGLDFYSKEKNFLFLKENLLGRKYEENVLFFEEVLKRKELDRSTVEEYFGRMIEYYEWYGKTEFFYTDKAFLEREKNVHLKKNLSSLDFVKMKGREHINEFLLSEGNFLRRLLLKIEKRFALPIDDLYAYSLDEILELFILENKKRIFRRKLSQRREGYFFEKNETALSMQARKKIRVFLSQVQTSKEIVGEVASGRGIFSGRACVITLSIEEIGESVGILVDAMKKGDILIAETTAPEIILACQKASAIITNQGGMLSHAAVISRELGIPCIVGTGWATHYIRTGDLVEVDADNGVVRILERAGESA